MILAGHKALKSAKMCKFQYWAEHSFLTVQDELLLKRTGFVISSSLRNEVLAKLHEGH